MKEFRENYHHAAPDCVAVENQYEREITALKKANAELLDLLRLIDRRLDIEAEENGHVKVFILAAHREQIKQALTRNSDE
jgi:uncharacterized protein YeaO (DUF488 family)